MLDVINECEMEAPDIPEGYYTEHVHHAYMILQY